MPEMREMKEKGVVLDIGEWLRGDSVMWSLAD